MRKLLWLALMLIAIIHCAPAMAQSGCSPTSNANTLYCAPILAVENTKVVNTSGNVIANVLNAVPPAFSALNAAVGIQLSEVPTPSPASGITFAFGPSGLTRQRELGPIFSEAPPTVGRHKLYVAFTYQYLQFDQIDATPLNQIPLQLNACLNTLAAGCGGFVVTSSRLDLSVHQFTAYATYGLFNRVDVSVAIPLRDVRMSMQTTCTVCGQQLPPQTGLPNGGTLIFTPNAVTAASTGLGDVTFRAKGTVIKGQHLGVAVGADVRTPTGNALDFLGAGTVGFRPFAAVGLRGRLSPHADLGYEVNGNSILASTAQSGTGHLPNVLNYSAGADFGVLHTLSITGDLLGQTFFAANRVYQGMRGTSPDTACNPEANDALPCQSVNFNTNNFAIGGKYIVMGNLLVSVNVLIKLDHNGLHYKPAPMIGLSYTF